MDLENITWEEFWKSEEYCSTKRECAGCVLDGYELCPRVIVGANQELVEWAYEQGMKSKQNCSTCGTTKQYALKHSAGWISTEEGEFCNECVKKMISNAEGVAIDGVGKDEALKQIYVRLDNEAWD